MSQTQAQLITSVLEDLSAIGIGESVAAADTTLVTKRYTTAVSDLTARRIYTVTNTNAIADEAFPHLVRIVAELCAPSFGRETKVDLIGASEAALASIARHAATGLTKSVLDQLETWGGGTATVDATLVAARIQGWLDDLAGRGILLATEEADVPSAAMPHLIRWGAAQLAPKPSFDVMELAERRMREQTRRGYRPPPLAFEPVLKGRALGGTYGW